MVSGRMRKRKKETETTEEIFANQCPHLHLWPVPSCHAKSGRIHIQSDQTVETFCRSGVHLKCVLFLQSQQTGALK
jgi:hypothetical protein